MEDLAFLAAMMFWHSLELGVHGGVKQPTGCGVVGQVEPRRVAAEPPVEPQARHGLPTVPWAARGQARHDTNCRPCRAGLIALGRV
ncbi:hypothetical protein OsJ_11280 [Oryza sativa Japonica Group]|uniref:Uncharacterized protein n=2 Tax=Oryza sativa subsp. japonica TaxID=39947 RepID=Q10JJ0_ORYSJ|nr:hypothetical protein [Oryza sativa Japonica Group]AAR01701.1 hypothetical protein [Oryza sativa Japonica Group]ABF96640.1 hypothetical protein LOC_Os03g30500 [Oryza sativa Japonica Group]EAZ27338.1 hypothetical protein OsJ_11280 [Oryza sativa Japonica Group]